MVVLLYYCIDFEKIKHIKTIQPYNNPAIKQYKRYQKTMENMGLYGLAFLLGSVKFLFAASLVSATSLSPFEIAVSTGLGAIFSFNIFYWSSGYFMRVAKEKQIRAIHNGTFQKKNAFTKMNKLMVKTKKSKSGFWLICIFAPLFLSIPIGSIIVAKFYRQHPLTYPVAIISISIFAFILAYLNEAIFASFK